MRYGGVEVIQGPKVKNNMCASLPFVGYHTRVYGVEIESFSSKIIRPKLTWVYRVQNMIIKYARGPK